MKKYSTLSYFFGCILLSACASQSSDQQKLDTTPASLSAYQQEVNAFKENVSAGNFDVLRASITDTQWYKPWDSTEHQASLALLDSISDENFTLCLQFADAILEQNYTSISGHYGAWACNRALNNEDIASYHKTLIQGLMTSINNSGDGLTPATAYIVNSETEMRDFVRFRSLLMYRQEELVYQGKHLRKLWASAPNDNNQDVELYFDISRALISQRPAAPMPIK